MSSSLSAESDKEQVTSTESSTKAINDRTDVTQEPELTSKADESAPSQEPDKASIAPEKSSLCGVCNTNVPKYKCPRCYLPYCSVACNKTHRENHPPDPEPKPKSKEIPAPDVQFNAPVQSSDPTNPFGALESSEQLRRLFQKYPGLPDQLLQIHAATQPPSDVGSQNPGIPASLLRGLPKKETWNHDIGIQNGKEALRKAMRADGEEGEAIREYSELILHLTNSQDAAGTEVTTMIRQQLAEEDTKLIERLIAQEKR